jgi:type II secretory pathway pseudopilin PulG
MTKFRRSQGLAETVVAITILITAIASLMTMVVAASNARNANQYATVAANLAREGIEVVVAKRNDNWINDLPFDNGMYVGTDYTFELSFNPVTNVWTFDNTPNLITDPAAQIYMYVSPAAYPGLMVQASSQPTHTVSTPYSRLVTLDCICYNGTAESIATSGSSCTGSNTKIGVRITSTVQWVYHASIHNISAVETIYDWR